MNDTHPEITAKMFEMIQAKSPAERLQMGQAMHQVSKSLIIHSIVNEQPNLSPQELRQAVFLKFYGDDFDGESREQICRHFNSKKEKAKGVTKGVRPGIRAFEIDPKISEDP